MVNGKVVPGTLLQGATVQVDGSKVECAARYVAQNHERDATVYKMYYRSPDIERGDTVFFYCTLFHLKAGSYEGDDRYCAMKLAKR